MSGLYVKLDAEYASDDKLIAAGPMAELLYVRGLAFCKRQMVDGTIKTNQLPAVALGIPSARKHADALVEHGAWEPINGGWYITAWLSRNKSVAEINDDREARRIASVEANHAQHHVGEGKKPSPKCELCRHRFAPKSAPISEANRTSNRLQEEEPEPEEEEKPEGKPEEEEEPEGSSSSPETSSRPIRAAKLDDDDFSSIITAVVDSRCMGRSMDDAGAYRFTTARKLEAEEGDWIRAQLADGVSTEAIAGRLINPPGTPAAQVTFRTPIAWCDITCTTCNGDAWIDAGDGLAPCPGRLAALKENPQ